MQLLLPIRALFKFARVYQADNITVKNTYRITWAVLAVEQNSSVLADNRGPGLKPKKVHAYERNEMEENNVLRRYCWTGLTRVS